MGFCNIYLPITRGQEERVTQSRLVLCKSLQRNFVCFRSQFKVTLQGLDMSWYMHSAGNVNILLMEEEKNAFLAFPEQIIT